MISPGDNTVRVAGLRMGTKSIYDVYQFNLINTEGHTHEFAFAVPAGSVAPPKIVRDLKELGNQKLWFTVYLKEKRRMLTIFSIKEPRAPQNELWARAKKVA